MHLGNRFSDRSVGFVDFVRCGDRDEFGADLGLRECVPEVRNANANAVSRENLPVNGFNVLVCTSPLPAVPLIFIAAVSFRP